MLGHGSVVRVGLASSRPGFACTGFWVLTAREGRCDTQKWSVRIHFTACRPSILQEELGYEAQRAGTVTQGLQRYTRCLGTIRGLWKILYSPNSRLNNSCFKLSIEANRKHTPAPIFQDKSLCSLSDPLCNFHAQPSSISVITQIPFSVHLSSQDEVIFDYLPTV